MSLYHEIKSEWNRLRLKEDADPDVLRFLVHVMDMLEGEEKLGVRLVDIDALRKEWRMPGRCEYCERCDTQIVTVRDICGWLDDAEIVDAKPVRRVELIDGHCSGCGWYIYSGDADNYCPHCGGMIRGEVTTE